MLAGLDLLCRYEFSNDFAGRWEIYRQRGFIVKWTGEMTLTVAKLFLLEGLLGGGLCRDSSIVTFVVLAPAVFCFKVTSFGLG